MRQLALLTCSVPFLLTAACSESGCDGDQVYAGDFILRGDDAGSRSLDELRCVEVITGDLLLERIEEPDSDALADLHHVLGSVTFEDSIVPVPNLALVGGDLRVSERGSPVLEDLDILKGLLQVEGDVILLGLGGVKDLNALSQLEAVGGALTVQSLDSLKTLSGLESLERADAVDLSYNESLEDVSALDELTLRALSLVSLPSLRELWQERLLLSGPIVIRDNAKLERVSLAYPRRPHSDGLLLRSCLDATVEVHDNPQLEVVNVYLAPEDAVSFVDNPKLTRIDASEGAGDMACLELLRLPALSEVELSDGLSVQGDLTISETGLTDLTDIAESIDVGCSLRVRSNPELRGLTDSLAVGGSAAIADNPQLPQCEVDAFADDWEPWERGVSHCDFPVRPEIMSGGNDGDASCG